ncbi:hypothetical protein V5074_22420 [Atlantibacter hermannii]|uniref:hypothetical protein n=1 Tax=Atlantibacter hermannii TaxID=565 RepID=UPI00307671F3
MTINERVSPKKPLFAEVHNVPDDYRFTTEELDRIISGDMFTPRQDAIMARELQQYRAAAEPVAWMVIDSDSGEKILRVDRSNIEGAAIPLYAAPQVTSVPDEIESTSGSDYDDYYCDGWNACHAAMLNGGKS